MATYNLTPSQTLVPVSAMAASTGRRVDTVEMIVDFSLPTLPSGVTAISGTSGTVIDCINVPAGFAVMGTAIEVLKADTSGNSGTLLVKVGSASQGSAQTVAATGFIASAGSFTAVVPSGSNTFVTLTVGTGTINAIVRVVAVLSDLRARVGSPVYVGTSTNPAGQATAYGWDPVSNYATALVYVL